MFLFYDQEINIFVSFCFCPSAGVLSSDAVLLWEAAVHYSTRRCLLQLPEQVQRVDDNKGWREDWIDSCKQKEEGSEQKKRTLKLFHIEVYHVIP